MVNNSVIRKGKESLMKVVAFLPAKGTSERIESKNMKLLNGKPLFLHTLEKLCECSFIDEVYLDTDSDEMLAYADYLRYKPFKRPQELATNKASGNMVFMNEVNNIDADIYIQIFSTTPFIKVDTIKKGIEIVSSSPVYDSAILVRSEKLYQLQGNQPLYPKDNIPNSITLPDTVSDTMGLYIIKREAALKGKNRYGYNPYLLVADPMEAIDINYDGDFELAEYVAKGLYHEEVAKLQSMAHFFNSSIFADILFDYGLNGVIAGYKLNLPEKKIFGRANTLKIRKLREGESNQGIYRTYDTYKRIREGEIIVVENEFDDRAYFGELNSNLAMRAGAIGTIVSGVTRDIEAVNKLQYPVFSTGYSCADIRGISNMESHNKPVKIKGVTINPGDLIFADVNGIVVIPKENETEVIEKAISTVRLEKNILDKVLANEDAYSIYQQVGEF